MAASSPTDTLSGVAPGSPEVAGTSSEPASGLGPDDLAPDNVITGGVVQLRAERYNTKTGRTYTLSATASDRAGNTATATATCVVPRSKPKK